MGHIRSVSQAIDNVFTAGGETAHAVNEIFPTLDGLSQTRPHGPQSPQGYGVCVLALSHWKQESFLMDAVQMGTVLRNC